MTTVLWVHPFEHSPPQSVPQYISLPSAEAQLDLLLIHENHSFSLLSIQPQNGRIELQQLPFHSTINGQSPAHLYNIGRKSDAKKILSVYFGTEIDRISSLNDLSFCRVIDLLQGISLEVQTEFSYIQSGIEVHFAAGVHHLNGEQCLRYLTSSPHAENSRRKQLFAAAVSRLLSVCSDENFRELYVQLLDTMDSDLSLADYDRCHASICFMAQLVENPVQVKERPPKQSFSTADVLSTE